jgi:hypothetical protein
LAAPSAALGSVGGVGTGGFWGGGWGAWYPGYPNDPWGYQTGRIPTPPYFAIHPPVYYGKRVGMPYGNSTVTRPPREIVDFYPSMQPVVHIRQPQLILNPFVSPVAQEVEEAAAPKSTKPAADRSRKSKKAEAQRVRRKDDRRSRDGAKSSRGKRNSGKRS